ncbi:MAG: endonuclease [Bacteriovoracaceae bacterium]|nr:endonuclease [Bacteriovoracaceae bacterium]
MKICTLFLLFVLGWINFAIAQKESYQIKTNRAIPDLGAVTINFDNFSISKIDNISLELAVEHTYIGDLIIKLVGPNNNTVTLHNRSGYWKNDLNLLVDTETDNVLKKFIGETAIGSWSLQVFDKARWDIGEVVVFKLLISGEIESPVTNTDCASNSLRDPYKALRGLCGNEFKQKLKDMISTNTNLGYRRARQIMFGQLDNVEGRVCSVYSPECIQTTSIPDGNVMNCEHTWPQSLGASGIAKSDLHHLYPTNSRKNSLRGNWPFCDVEEVISGDDYSALGYNSSGAKCFEPPSGHKGNVARSMFYFSIRYGFEIEQQQEAYLRQWHQLDQIDEKETRRNEDIEVVQNNRNPFVDHPEFVSIIDDY